MKRSPIKQSEPKKVFDVTRPGKMAASATSRPVIVGHKPLVKDPMVAEEEQELMDGKKKVTIEPTGAPVVPESKAPDTSHDTADSAAPVKPADQITHTPEKDEEFPSDGLASVATSSVIDTPPPVEDDDEKTPQPPLPPADLSSDDEPDEPKAELEQPEESKPESEPAPSKPSEETQEESKPIANPDTEITTSGAVFDESPTMSVPKPDSDAEPLPVLPEEDSMQKQIIISHHADSNKSGMIIILIALLLLGVLIFDVLLDAGIIVLQGIPHTNLF